MIACSSLTTTNFIVTTKGQVTAMEEPVKVASFAKCASCGKLTFVDLLDENMTCEYCREQRRIRASRKKKRGAGEKLKIL